MESTNCGLKRFRKKPKKVPKNGAGTCYMLSAGLNLHAGSDARLALGSPVQTQVVLHLLYTLSTLGTWETMGFSVCGGPRADPENSKGPCGGFQLVCSGVLSCVSCSLVLEVLSK